MGENQEQLRRGGAARSPTFFKRAYILNYFAMILLPAVFVFRQGRRPGSPGQKELTTETQRHGLLR